MKIFKLRRPDLNSIKLTDAIQNMTSGNGGFYLTVSPGQWDNILNEAYYRQDATLIEIGKSGFPIAAYKFNTIIFPHDT